MAERKAKGKPKAHMPAHIYFDDAQLASWLDTPVGADPASRILIAMEAGQHLAKDRAHAAQMVAAFQYAIASGSTPDLRAMALCLWLLQPAAFGEDARRLPFPPTRGKGEKKSVHMSTGRYQTALAVRQGMNDGMRRDAAIAEVARILGENEDSERVRGSYQDVLWKIGSKEMDERIAYIKEAGGQHMEQHLVKQGKSLFTLLAESAAAMIS